MNDTIVAIATALAEGAISIIRISGRDAISIAQKIFSKDLNLYSSHTMIYGYIKDPFTKEILDEVLLTTFRAPKSFTCEDVVEINCHGGVVITKKILKMVIACGARLAKPGEFSQRAFLNGRIDLTQAEAIMSMISAQNEISAKQAIRGVCGSIRKLLNPYMQELLDMIAHIEVNIDYPEYDINEISYQFMKDSIGRWIIEIDNIIEISKRGNLFHSGVRTAIIGKPNAGKSSLLNALIDEEKAIVTDIAGTTRDIVEGYIQLRNVRLHLLDTAGIRESCDEIEKIGIQKSYEQMEQAEFVLLVFDASKTLDEEDYALLEKTKHKKRIVVYNKCDLVMKKNPGVNISAKNKEIQELIDAIELLYKEDIEIVNSTILSNDRQIAYVMRAKEAMQKALEAIHEEIALDLVAIDIQYAYQCLQEVFGEYHREDLLDVLFSNFCLGK